MTRWQLLRRIRDVGCWVAAALCPVLGGGTATAGLIEGIVPHQGIDRDYLLYLPEADPLEPLPLIIALHGGGNGDNRDLMERTGFVDVAEEHGFAVAFPNGYQAQWNDGRSGTLPAMAGIDDVGFIDQLITDIVDQHGVDPRRVYVTGGSNGGMLSMRLGVELSHRLAGIAPVISCMPVELIDLLDGRRPVRPLHVLMMMGTEDPLVPYEGGTIPGGQGSGGGGDVVSAPATRDIWLDYLGNAGVVPLEDQLPDLDPDDGSVVNRQRYFTDIDSPDLMFYSIDGAGHNWPGGPDYPPGLVGRTNHDIIAAQEIWAFFAGRSQLAIPEPTGMTLAIATLITLIGTRPHPGGKATAIPTQGHHQRSCP